MSKSDMMGFSETPQKQKTPRIRFGHLRGNTAWARLITWMRRRRLRAFTIYSVIVLFFFGFMGWAAFLSGPANTGGDFWAAFSALAPLLCVYLIPWVWMLVWIIVPQKHHQVRRLKQLGDARAIAQALEADLSSPDGIQYQKGGVLVTRRFIVYTGFFAFFIYPLAGLVQFDFTVGVPILRYENGINIRGNNYIPFKRIQKYLSGDIASAPVKKPSKRKILLIKVLPAFGFGVFLFLLYAAATVNSIIGRLFFPLFFGCFFAVLIAIIVKNNSKAIKAARMLSAIKDIDEKIDKINELQAKGFYKNTLGQYFNQISVAYYEKGDNEKALALIREAYAAETNTGLLFGRGVTISDVYRMNEVSYLIALGQIEEAERFIRLIDEGRFKQPNVLNHILTSRAQIAVRKGNAAAAKELLREARALPIKMPKDVADNIRWNLLLIEAECDLLGGEIEAARSKLGDITAHCPYGPTIKRAEEIMNSSPMYNFAANCQYFL